MTWIDCGEQVRIVAGDCIDMLATLDENSIDAVVCDPPYGLEFMGKEWDGADGFRRSLNPNDAGRDDPFGRASRRAPEYKSVGAGRKSKPGIGERTTEWPIQRGWNEKRCANCGHLSHGGSPCQCDEPQFVRADNRWNLYQQWCEQWAEQCLRVLKPGGHMLAFGGTRTYHRLACAIEDAGFEIRDSIHWLYGSGFPKSLDVSKAIDKQAGATGTYGAPKSEAHAGWIERGRMRGDDGHDGYQRPWMQEEEAVDRAARTYEPATSEAEQWQGWGTAAKPAHEPIVVARKPLAGTVAQNVVRYGTGALNIDACRVAGVVPQTVQGAQDNLYRGPDGKGPAFRTEPMVSNPHASGRWPANVIVTHNANCKPTGEKTVPRELRVSHATDTPGKTTYGSNGPGGGSHSEGSTPETITIYDCTPGCPAAALDQQSGTLKSAIGAPAQTFGAAGFQDAPRSIPGQNQWGDEGGASRFFAQPEWDPILDAIPFRYVPKASTSERNEGLTGTEVVGAVPPMRSLQTRECRVCGSRAKNADPNVAWPTCGHDDWEWTEQKPGSKGTARNIHPTVKPVALMRWLVRLVTPPDGTVCDPFLGSGTTAIACVQEHVACIGIEKDATYVQIAETRIRHAVAWLYDQQQLF